MKQCNLIVMALFAMFLAACGNGGKINPTSKKVNGPLGKYFEVVERDYKISDDELSVEFMRIAEGGPTSASWSSEPTFTVELQDEDGNVLSSESTQVVRSEEQLESVFSLGVDETASIKFKFDKTKGAVKFKVSSKWDESKESESGSQEENSTSGSDGTFDLKGSVDKYPVTMHLEIEGSQIKGSYYYDKQGASSKLKLSGTAEDGLWDINETDADGTPTGHFKGKYVNGVYSGHFVTNQGKKMPFTLTKGDVDDSDFEVDSDYDDNDIEASSSSGSEDWDELLDSYENYVDKYISYLKKAAKGDMTALAEYPSLMEKAQGFSNKMQNAQGEMSVSQWARYTKITMKMMKAAQEMQQ